MKRLPKQNYTLEFKQEAVRQIEVEGKRQAEVARELGVIEQTLHGWRKAYLQGKLAGASSNGKPISALEMELSRVRAENARLKMEVEILKKSDGVLCKRASVKYAWIRQHERAYPLNAMCDVLGVSESGFAAWRAGSAAKRWLSTPQLLALIRAIHAEFNGAYGAPRMAREIKARGSPVSKERVGKLMQANRIRARHKCCYKATTNSAHHLPVAQNVLNRLFQTTAPDQVWTADITYIQTAEGWLYLAVIMDLYSRMIVGYAMDARMTKELVLNALRMARFKRKPKPGLIHHSDRGSQYCSHDHQALIADMKAVSSMSGKGNCWDKAPMESWFNSLKNERVFHRRDQTRDEAKADLFDYIDVFYNRKQRHSGLGYGIPSEFHSAWLAQQKLAA